jgi:endonuclease/exonuclease/phosphatase family metal-dependent hydrolase
MTGSGTQPYGELIPTTVRVLTWNVWGRFGPWQEREAALIGTLRALEPDVVALQEAWCDRGGQDQAARLAKALGYHGAYGGGTSLAEDWGTGSGLLSRWPIEQHEYREFPAAAPDRWGGSALFAHRGAARAAGRILGGSRLAATCQRGAAGLGPAPRFVRPRGRGAGVPDGHLRRFQCASRFG